ncbi:MAG TPA: hypothetical protein VFL85_04395, partial [Candidatus Saccharimonadales bacterium]|nr:hypothetical protein [Candidatus Saccharimonadales bacterium]
MNQEDIAATKRLLEGELTFNQQLLRPVVNTSATYLYLPEMHLRLPYSRLAQTIAYNFRGD